MSDMRRHAAATDGTVRGWRGDLGSSFGRGEGRAGDDILRSLRHVRGGAVYSAQCTKRPNERDSCADGEAPLGPRGLVFGRDRKRGEKGLRITGQALLGALLWVAACCRAASRRGRTTRRVKRKK